MSDLDVSDLDVALLTAAFDARPGAEEALLATLARYVVLTRHEPACRNVDLIASCTHDRRFVVIEKWDSADAIREICKETGARDREDSKIPVDLLRQK